MLDTKYLLYVYTSRVFGVTFVVHEAPGIRYIRYRMIRMICTLGPWGAVWRCGWCCHDVGSVAGVAGWQAGGGLCCVCPSVHTLCVCGGAEGYPLLISWNDLRSVEATWLCLHLAMLSPLGSSRLLPEEKLVGILEVLLYAVMQQ